MNIQPPAQEAKEKVKRERRDPHFLYLLLSLHFLATAAVIDACRPRDAGDKSMQSSHYLYRYVAAAYDSAAVQAMWGGEVESRIQNSEFRIQNSESLPALKLRRTRPAYAKASDAGHPFIQRSIPPWPALKLRRAGPFAQKLRMPVIYSSNDPSIPGLS